MTGSRLKIVLRSEAEKIVKEHQKQGQQVGFTSGSFDLLHPGHVAYLEAARALCDFLVVGLNTDASVRLYKSSDRPICSEEERCRVIAGLASVDLVFSFDERNNHKNIEVLRPDLYIKAGDYDKSQLTSAPLVEQYGGSVVLVAAESGYSTTGIIERILSTYSAREVGFARIESREPGRAVFLDRDGTINEHIQYLHEPSKFQLLPGVIEGLQQLQEAGFRLVVTTNQPGIGLGYFSVEDFFRVNKRMMQEFSAAGISIDKIYFSPHTKADNSNWRKPGTGMIERAKRELNLDLQSSYVIGDTTTDIAFGTAAGVRTVLVATGEGGRDGHYSIVPDLRAMNFKEAADLIVAEA